MADAEIIERYDRRALAFDATVRGVSDGSWENPTPCPDWSARQLLQHVANNAGLFLGLVGEPTPQLPPATLNPLETWRASDRAVRDALADDAIADRIFTGYFGPTTFARAIDGFLSFDLAVHRWDLARATGQDERIPPDEIDQLFDAAHGFGDALRSSSVCGPPLDPPPSADEQTRLLAFLGRQA